MKLNWVKFKSRYWAFTVVSLLIALPLGARPFGCGLLKGLGFQWALFGKTAERLSPQVFEQVQQSEKLREPRNYHTLAMRAEFEGEADGGASYWFNWANQKNTQVPRISYLSENQRAIHRIYFYKDKVYDAEGVALCASGPCQGIFVMDPQGRFYFSLSSQEAVFHHSSFLAGGAISAAGHLEFDRGKLVHVNNASGHYKPPAITNYFVLMELIKRGVSLPKTMSFVKGIFDQGHPDRTSRGDLFGFDGAFESDLSPFQIKMKALLQAYLKNRQSVAPE